MKKSYIKGILGSLIGGILFSIPWVLVYVYLNYILSILAAVIALGAFTFYKLCGGKINKKAPLIIGISSVLSVTLAMFVIIPIFLLFKEGYGFNINKFKLLYMNNTFISAIMKDYITSLIFTALGISGVIANIRNEVYSKNEENNKTSNIENYNEEDQINVFRKVYENFNAYSKNNTVPNSIILSKINLKNKNVVFKELQKKGIIVTTLTGKSYFNEEAIHNSDIGKKVYKQYVQKIIIIIVLICVSLIVITFISDFSYNGNHNTKDIKEKNSTFNNISIFLPETYKIEETSENYKVFTNYGKTGPNQIILQQVNIVVKNEEKSNYKDSYINYISSSEDIKNVTETKINGLDSYKILSVHKDYTNEYYYTYLIFGTSNTYLVSFYTSIINPNDSKYLEEFRREVNIFSNKIIINEGQL